MAAKNVDKEDDLDGDDVPTAPATIMEENVKENTLFPVRVFLVPCFILSSPWFFFVLDKRKVP